MTLADFLPAGLDPLLAIGLVAFSLFTSFVTATLSLGGGMLMVAVLALVFPPMAIVPLHAAIQFGSNAGRALVQRAHIQWSYFLWMSSGAVVGTLVGGQLVSIIPGEGLLFAIGVFVLVSTWIPSPKVIARTGPARLLGGAVIAALGMIVGPTGPLVALYLKGLPDRHQLVATHAVLMTAQNGLKLAMFVALGFAFADYLPLIIAMVGSGLMGTLIGSRLLVHVPERAFRLGFRIVLSVVAVGILLEALA
ncbi:sulfite exporter TauE/SafE family protein [Devosia sp.]|uniref:sulfite exporter TauE/SafE family protein n=1 Tax=Devosia sp. TaxID=1871048 RepID=UPI003A8CE00B